VELNEIIGTGARATVYRSGEYAIKLYNEGYDRTAVFYEALINSIVEGTKLHIPSVHEVLNINNQMALSMDYLKGISLMDCIINDMENATRYVDDMVKLQIDIHSRKVWLPFSLKDRLRRKIASNQDLRDEKKNVILESLDKLPDDNALCHGDFHGYNILSCHGQYWIIDWVDSTSGCADGDACRTYMIYLFYAPELADLYLKSYCKHSGKEKGQILMWLPVIAAARLSENIPKEKEKIMQLINVH
jgi:tRNA A-37 threonylcarbamoyl transferase component Bud32